MGTVGGLRTRRYHGLLVVATAPPIGRMVGLRRARPGPRDRRSAHPAGDPRMGRRHDRACGPPPSAVVLTSRDGVPLWRWAVGDVVLEAEVAMVHGRPAVGVTLPARPRARARAARARGVVHVARRARRAIRRRGSADRAHGRRLRVRGRVPRARPELRSARRIVVAGRPPPRGGGPRPERSRGRLDGRPVRRRPRDRRRPWTSRPGPTISSRRRPRRRVIVARARRRAVEVTQARPSC